MNPRPPEAVIVNPPTTGRDRARLLIAQARAAGDALDFGFGLEAKIMAALDEWNHDGWLTGMGLASNLARAHGWEEAALKIDEIVRHCPEADPRPTQAVVPHACTLEQRPDNHQCGRVLWTVEGRHFHFCTEERGHFGDHRNSTDTWNDAHDRAAKWVPVSHHEGYVLGIEERRFVERMAPLVAQQRTTKAAHDNGQAECAAAITAASDAGWSAAIEAAARVCDDLERLRRGYHEEARAHRSRARLRPTAGRCIDRRRASGVATAALRVPEGARRAE